MEELTDREIDSILNALLITSLHYTRKADKVQETVDPSSIDDEYVPDLRRLAENYYALYLKVKALVIE